MRHQAGVGGAAVPLWREGEGGDKVVARLLVKRDVMWLCAWNGRDLQRAPYFFLKYKVGVN